MFDERRYSAFISYSHSDETVARWLHRRVERYRVPSQLVGVQGADGPVSRRLNAVFRDREEFAAGGDLKAEIEEALSRSSALIVLCSPRAAASSYVQSEIAYFQSLGRGSRIIPVILAGEPAECFPPGLRDGQDRLGADFRKGRDERENGSLKVLAGLLGVGLDTLVQRERRAQRWRMRAAMAMAALFAVLAIAAIAFGIRSEQQRVRSEANRLASEAQLASEQDQALMLAVAAWRISPTAPARAALFSALSRNPQLDGMGRIEGGVHELHILADGRIVFRASGVGETALTVGPGENLNTAHAIEGVPGGAIDVSVLDGGKALAVLREDALSIYRVAPSWDAASLTATHPVSGEPVLASARDGQVVALLTAPHSLAMFDAATGHKTGEEALPFELGEVSDFAVSPKGDAVVVGTQNSVWLKAGSAWRQLMTPPVEPARLVEVRFDQDGGRVVAAIGVDEDWTGTSDAAEALSRLACWLVADANPVPCPHIGVIAWPGLLGPVSDGLVMSGRRDLRSAAQLAEVWVRAGDEWTSSVLRADPTFLTNLAADAEGRRLLVGTIDGELLAYSTGVFGPGVTTRLSGDPQMLRWTAAGCRTIAKQQSLLVSETCDGGDRRTLTLGPDDAVRQMETGSEGLYAVHKDGSVTVWDERLATLLEAPAPPNDAVRYSTGAVFDVSAKSLYAIATDNDRVLAFKAGDTQWRGIAGNDEPVRALALGRSGVIYLGFEQRGAIRAVDLATGRALFETVLPKGQYVGRITPSPDGRHLYVTAMTNRHSLFKLDAVSGALAADEFNRFSGPAHVLAISPDGRYLVISGVGAPDGKAAISDARAFMGVELWDANVLAPVGGFRTRASDWLSAFSPDGSSVALAANSPYEVAIIPLDPESWVRAACRKASRTLTADEHRRFSIPDDKDGCR